METNELKISFFQIEVRMKMDFKNIFAILKPQFCSLFFILMTACAVGPNYKKPSVIIPEQYKEAPKGWKFAEPQDQCDRGAWWEIFKDVTLNSLEEKLIKSNQTVAQAEANYRQALAVVDEARASLYPTLGLTADVIRQKQGSGATAFSSSGSVFSPGATGSTGTQKITNSHTLSATASWIPDLWGNVRRTIEADEAAAEASLAAFGLAKLAAEASLAQFYFQLRTLDLDQKILDDTVLAYKKSLQLTKNRYNQGVAALSDVVQAQSQLEIAKANAINNNIARKQTEHAIAVLIGIPPADFGLDFSPLIGEPPLVPRHVPSELLERRPDIAQAERLMAQANALIGVAISAYFPTLTLSADGSYSHKGFSHWLSVPDASWSIAAQLAQTIIDGGLRSATIRAARAAYDANVASYRQTVLAAFQNVEDNLAAINILKKQMIVEKKAVASARLALKLVTNQYKAGLVDYTSVITAQNTAYTAEKTAADVRGQEMTATVGLVQALGGGWSCAEIGCETT